MSCASRVISPPRKAWCWWPRSSTTRPTTTRSNSPAGAWQSRQGRHRGRRASGRGARCLVTPGTCRASVKPGDVIQMLNIGGVMGICDSATPDKGKPFDARVLGVVLQFPYLGERIGVPARVGLHQLDFNAPLETLGMCRWWHWPVPAWKRARPPRRPRSSDACVIAAWWSMRSRPPACRCAGTSWRSPMPARVAR
jgi:hypothetical protein